jgi:hypothetical protein
MLDEIKMLPFLLFCSWLIPLASEQSEKEAKTTASSWYYIQTDRHWRSHEQQEEANISDTCKKRNGNVVYINNFSFDFHRITQTKKADVQQQQQQHSTLLCHWASRVYFSLNILLRLVFLSLRYFSLTQEKYKTELDWNSNPSNLTHFESNRLKRYNNMFRWRDR